MELRLLHFSAGDDEYIVVTDEGDDASDWALSGYKLVCEAILTPQFQVGSANQLPLGYEMHRRD